MFREKYQNSVLFETSLGVLTSTVPSHFFPGFSQTTWPERSSLVPVPPIQEVIASLVLSCLVSFKNKLGNADLQWLGVKPCYKDCNVQYEKAGRCCRGGKKFLTQLFHLMLVTKPSPPTFLTFPPLIFFQSFFPSYTSGFNSTKFFLICKIETS